MTFPVFLPHGSAQPQDSSWSARLEAERERYRQQLQRTLDQPGMTPHFFPPDGQFRLMATFRPASEPEPFIMPAMSGEPERYVAFGTLHFLWDGRPMRLTLYRNLDRLRLPGGRERLLLPFRDATNGTSTFAAGRYLELSTSEMHGERVRLDFNRSYFPLCAHGAKVACPLPPEANSLPFSVRAGERWPPD